MIAHTEYQLYGLIYLLLVSNVSATGQTTETKQQHMMCCTPLCIPSTESMKKSFLVLAPKMRWVSDNGHVALWFKGILGCPNNYYRWTEDILHISLLDCTDIPKSGSPCCWGDIWRGLEVGVHETSCWWRMCGKLSKCAWWTTGKLNTKFEYFN